MMENREYIGVFELMRHRNDGVVQVWLVHKVLHQPGIPGQQHHQMTPLQVPVQTPLVIPELILRLLMRLGPSPQRLPHQMLESPKRHIDLAWVGLHQLQVLSVSVSVKFNKLKCVEEHVVPAEVVDALGVDLDLAEVVAHGLHDESAVHGGVDL